MVQLLDEMKGKRGYNGFKVEVEDGQRWRL